MWAVRVAIVATLCLAACQGLDVRRSFAEQGKVDAAKMKGAHRADVLSHRIATLEAAKDAVRKRAAADGQQGSPDGSALHPAVVHSSRLQPEAPATTLSPPPPRFASNQRLSKWGCGWVCKAAKRAARAVREAAKRVRQAAQRAAKWAREKAEQARRAAKALVERIAAAARKAAADRAQALKEKLAKAKQLAQQAAAAAKKAAADRAEAFAEKIAKAKALADKVKAAAKKAAADAAQAMKEKVEKAKALAEEVRLCSAVYVGCGLCSGGRGGQHAMVVLWFEGGAAWACSLNG